MVREFRKGSGGKYAYTTIIGGPSGVARSGTIAKDDAPKAVDDVEKLARSLIKKGYVEIQRGRHASAKTPPVELEPADLAFATWRPRAAPAMRPEPAPFDREACLAKLRRVEVRAFDWNFRDAYPPSMTALEATFWHEACRRASMKTTPDEVATALASLPFDKPLAAADVTEMPTRWERAPLIAAILGPDGFLELLLGGKGLVPTWLLLELAASQLPYMSEETVARWRDRLRPKIVPSAWPADNGAYAPRELYVAALLGMSGELGAVVASWPNGRYAAPPDKPWVGVESIKAQLPHLVVYGLDSEARVREETKRLGIGCFAYWGQCEGWLAHTLLSDLDYLMKSVETRVGPQQLAKDPAQARYSCEYQLHCCFSKVHAGLTSWMLGQLEGPARNAARVWLLENDPQALDQALSARA